MDPSTILDKYPSLTKQFIESEYFTLNKSRDTICKEQNIAQYKLKILFEYYQIPDKPIGSHCKTSVEEKIHKIILQHPFATESFMREQYVDRLKSFPDLQSEFGINYDQTKKLLSFYNIPIRTISQAVLSPTYKTKLHSTLKIKYGVDTNISQSIEIKQKKSKKCLDKFGVDNFFKKHDFKRIKEEGYQQRYGMSCSEWKRLKSAEVWASKTEEEKRDWLDRSIQSDSSKLKSIKGYRESKGESIVSEVLTALQITHTRQFIIKYEEGTKKRRYFYDIYVPALNILIEFNGDYWHANPLMYNAEDILRYPYGETTAAERWKKDDHKRSVAIDRKYNIIVVWESEINKLTNEQLIQLIKNKIYDIKTCN